MIIGTEQPADGARIGDLVKVAVQTAQVANGTEQCRAVLLMRDLRQN